MGPSTRSSSVPFAASYWKIPFKYGLRFGFAGRWVRRCWHDRFWNCSWRPIVNMLSVRTASTNGSNGSILVPSTGRQSSQEISNQCHESSKIFCPSYSSSAITRPMDAPLLSNWSTCTRMFKSVNSIRKRHLFVQLAVIWSSPKMSWK